MLVVTTNQPRYFTSEALKTRTRRGVHSVMRKPQVMGPQAHGVSQLRQLANQVF